MRGGGHRWRSTTPRPISCTPPCGPSSVPTASAKQVRACTHARLPYKVALKRVLLFWRAGSLVAPDRLRFDYTHGAPLTAEQRAAVETHVAAAVAADAPVRVQTEPRTAALARGALALFGDKYGDTVRTVEVRGTQVARVRQLATVSDRPAHHAAQVPGVSLELCGGTHVARTGALYPFVLVADTAVAAGAQRPFSSGGPHGAHGARAPHRAVSVPRGGR
jgi:alanyl-tRNA synthetase